MVSLLERVIAALPTAAASSDSATPGDSVRLPLLVDTLRAPLLTETPEARQSYQRITGPEHGFVKVTYAGGIAQVRVDGRTHGFTPQVIRVDAGQRFISLIGNAYTPLQIVLDVQPGDTALAAFKVPAASKPDSVARPPASPAAGPPATAQPAVTQTPPRPPEPPPAA
jgi:hypothetical protein